MKIEHFYLTVGFVSVIILTILAYSINFYNIMWKEFREEHNCIPVQSPSGGDIEVQWYRCDNGMFYRYPFGLEEE
jgi:hypothetical protein